MLSGLLSFCVYVSCLMLFELLPVHFVLSFAFFVMRCKLSANAGACLSLKGELAQEHERIRHLQRIEKNKTYKVYRQ